MREHIIRVDTETCIGCGQCQRDCPANNLLIADKKAAVRTQDCIKCGHCVAVCPKGAVSMTGFEEQPQEIDGPIHLNPQQLLEALRTRRSIRQFKDQPVPPGVIAQIVEAGCLTPTGGNAQNVSYLLLKDGAEPYEKLAVRFFHRLLPLARLVNPMAKHMVIDEHFFFKKAPVVIVVLSRDKVNGALAASNMELMAEACGLGVLYSGFFAMAANRSRFLRKALGLKHKEKAVTALVLGYSNVTYHRTVQKEAADIRSL